MKRLTIIFILFISFQSFAINSKPSIDSGNDSLIWQVKNIISSVQVKFAPDRRLAVFDISVQVDSLDKKVFITGETNIQAVKDEVTKLLSQKKIDYKIDLVVLPEIALNDSVYGIINVSVANIRSDPSYPKEMVTQALLGTPVKILKKNYIQTPDNYLGWVFTASIIRFTKEQIREWKDERLLIYTAKYGNVFEAPSIKSQIVSDIVAGNILRVIGEERKFYKVKFPDGKRTGFIAKREAENFYNWLANMRATPESIAATARQFMGHPYLWGGTSSKGMDCSGYTKLVYFLNGIMIQRDASQQVLYGETVDSLKNFSKLQPGDLIFFGTNKRVGHVAISLGGTEYIHSGGILQINSFDPLSQSFSESTLKIYIKTMRILSNTETNGISLVKNNSFYNFEF